MRWIKTAGIIGIVFLVLSFGSFVYSLFGGLDISGWSSWIIISFAVIFLAGFFFFCFGFAKVGKKKDSKLLQVSSWLVVAGVFLVLLSFLFVWLSVKSAVESGAELINQNAALLNQNSGFDFDGQDFQFTGNVVGVDSLVGSKGFILGLAIFSLLLLFVGLQLFYISLAEISHKTRFSKLAAIFGILFVSSYVIVIGLSLSFLLLLFDFESFFWKVILNIPFVLWFLALFFKTRVLFETSDEFEKNEGTNYEVHKHLEDSSHSENFKSQPRENFGQESFSNGHESEPHQQQKYQQTSQQKDYGRAEDY